MYIFLNSKESTLRPLQEGSKVLTLNVIVGSWSVVFVKIATKSATVRRDRNFLSNCSIR